MVRWGWLAGFGRLLLAFEMGLIVAFAAVGVVSLVGRNGRIYKEAAGNQEAGKREERGDEAVVGLIVCRRDAIGGMSVRGWGFYMDMSVQSCGNQPDGGDASSILGSSLLPL